MFLNSNLKPFLKCKDFTVSGKTFLLLENKELEMLVTSPKPKSKDLAKYYESKDYISHTDSKKTVIDKIYQIAKNYAIKKKVKLITTFRYKNTNNNSVLDIGCGTGDFLLACKNVNFNVTGIEPNKNARVRAKSKLGVLASKLETIKNLDKIHESIKTLENQKFNIITMWHVLEHVPNLKEYIFKLKELLKENGTLIIAVPNYKSYDAKYYQQFWAAYDVPRHLWHFSKKSIKLLFKKENMKVVRMLPMRLDSFYVSLLSEKYKTQTQKYIKPFFIGLKSNIKAIHTKEHSSIIYVIKNI